DACLCQNDVYNFVSSDPVAMKGVRRAGKSSVISTIKTMIKNNGRVCHYPDHAIATCTKGNPCKFDCKDGYQPFPRNNPTQCVCNKPYMECNGKCGQYQGCPSGRPHYRRTRDYLCPAEMKACGTWNRGARSWECIDTDNELESCGGCVIALPGEEEGGEDCSKREGNVGCVEGRCVTLY
ncbi:hypothetical protein AGABI2DRAFT_77834, partial [Agaricus bisporus var. bisporus H97]|uniref:hypothetical protein n=1 Tax=Agaricus bisporus var. bisporus (strain H97 / ATCC MYA-4626 / FGSC 10389) TaxID=936046 RepID=UPI00029F5668